MDRARSRLRPFDPDAVQPQEITLPDDLLIGVGGGIVTLIVTPDVIDSPWSRRTAVVLAAAWSSGGSRIVLVDLSLTNPVLHEALGLSNDEGIVDAFLRDAPLESVWQPVGHLGFNFVAVGPPLGDPTEITLSDRWDLFARGAQNAHTHVVLFAPADLGGLDGVLRYSTTTFLLAGEPSEAEWVAESFALEEVVGLTESGDPDSATVDGPVATESPSPESDPAPQVDPAKEPARERDSLTRAVASSPRKLRRPLWLVAVAGTLIALGGWAMMKISLLEPGPVSTVVEPTATFQPTQSAPNLDTVIEPPRTPQPTQRAPNLDTVTEPPGTPQPTQSVPDPDPVVEPHQAFSLLIAAYQTDGVAERVAGRLARRRPDLAFIVAPVRVRGVIYGRVLAGPAETSREAEALRASLAESLPDEDSSRWLVRRTPLAFELGDFDSSEEARARVSELRGNGVFAYVFARGTQEQPSFRVYAGAYSDDGEAAVMKARLDSLAGQAPPLERRAGRPVW